MRRNSFWIGIDEAAASLALRPDQVVCLVRDGILSGRCRGIDEISVLGHDVQRMAKLLPPPEPSRSLQRRRDLSVGANRVERGARRRGGAYKSARALLPVDTDLIS